MSKGLSFRVCECATEIARKTFFVTVALIFCTVALAQPAPQNNVVSWQKLRVERLNSRVKVLEGQRLISAADKELISTLKAQLQKESPMLQGWEELGQRSTSVNQGRGTEHPGIVVGGASGAAVLEKDWRVVFDFYPGLRGRFNEIVNLDAREDELFRERHDPAMFPIWKQIFAKVYTLWEPFMQEMTRKLSLLGTPRQIQITLNGHINDEDPFPFDAEETLDYADTFRANIRFGEMFPIQYKPVADEVQLVFNLQCRLVVGPADTVMLEVTGPVDLFESGDKEGNININESLAHGATSKRYLAHGEDEKDSGTIHVRFDFVP